MTAKTSTERVRRRDKRLKSEGYKLLRNFWVKVEHEAAVRLYADKLGKEV